MLQPLHFSISYVKEIAAAEREIEYLKSAKTRAFIYKQLTDVEQEINGILTHDRAELKFHAAALTSANRGQPVLMPANPYPDLVPNAQEGPVNWRYLTENAADH